MTSTTFEFLHPPWNLIDTGWPTPVPAVSLIYANILMSIVSPSEQWNGTAPLREFVVSGDFGIEYDGIQSRGWDGKQAKLRLRSSQRFLNMVKG